MWWWSCSGYVCTQCFMLMEKGSNFILFVDIYLEYTRCVYPLGKQEPIRGLFFRFFSLSLWYSENICKQIKPQWRYVAIVVFTSTMEIQYYSFFFFFLFSLFYFFFFYLHTYIYKNSTIIASDRFQSDYYSLHSRSKDKWMEEFPKFNNRPVGKCNMYSVYSCNIYKC